MPALILGLLGAIVMMASMVLVALGIAGAFVTVPKLGATMFDQPAWHWLALSIGALTIGFTLYFATACAVGWVAMQ
jgi:hypothetical protein